IAGGTQTPASPSLNPFQQPNIAEARGFIAKLTANSDRVLMFVTLNGTKGTTVSRSISVDPSGAIFVLALTTSPHLPIKNAFQKDFKAAFQNGYLAKLTSDGRSVLWASYYGGTGWEVVFRHVATPDGGYVFSGNTSSHDLPVKNAFQPVFGGGTNDC